MCIYKSSFRTCTLPYTVAIAGRYSERMVREMALAKEVTVAGNRCMENMFGGGTTLVIRDLHTYYKNKKH